MVCLLHQGNAFQTPHFLTDDLGTRVELKNMNSIQGMIDAAEYEAKRQVIYTL